jgi:hypothetical protein
MIAFAEKYADASVSVKIYTERISAMKVKCNEVVLGNRFRKNVGELGELMESISVLGLLQPIGITEDMVLVFGQRRLRACQILGHEEIEARIVDVPTIIEGEYAENEIRKDFSVSERVAIGKAMEDGIGERRGGLRRKGVKPQNFGKREDQLSGKETRSIAGGVAGFGNHETYRQAKIVVEKGTPDLVAKVDSGKVSVSAAYKEIQYEEKKREREQQIQEAVSRFEEDVSIRIICADFFPWCLEHLEENSVDLILTDPPYPKEFLPVWGQLGEVASKVLKPGGYLATYSGHFYLTHVMRSLEQHLSYCWTVAVLHTGPTKLFLPRNAVSTWKPILIFRKGEPGRFKDTLFDSIRNDNRDKRFHEWGQGESAVAYLMKTLSDPNDLVLDPFAGGGTTLAVAKALKRRCVGIEIEPKYLNAIKSRCV